MYLWPEKKADIKQSIAAKANIVPSGYNVAPLAANIPNSAMVALLNAQQGGGLGATANQTGLPDALKERFESRFGMPLDDVQVHRNSDAPAAFDAEAYAKGNEIFLGPGREQHLEHELGHVVQHRSAASVIKTYFNHGIV